ncbi:hypothetical protein chiPu_0014527, partial [Chiloscyllium punctatum]|nr:hypothetical protein [Chiloscyllium punctatum]
YMRVCSWVLYAVSLELPKLKDAEDNHTDKMDVTQLSNEELKEQLMKHGVTPGPIVDTEEEDDFPAEGSTHSRIGSSYQRQSTSITATAASSTSKSELTQPKDMGDVLPQIFPDEMNSPSGINATRRRPIKGAAGRPIQYNFDDLLTRATESHHYKERSGYLVTKENKPVKRLIPVWLQILLFIIVLFILFLVYQAMESNQENPFAYFLANTGNEAASPPEQLDTQATPNVDS